MTAPRLVELPDEQLSGLGRGAPVHVPQVVAGDVLAQRVEGEVAHRQLLARRTVEVVGQSSGEDGQVGHPRRHEQLEHPADLVAGDSSGRPDRSSRRSPVRPRALRAASSGSPTSSSCREKGREERQAQTHVRGPTGTTTRGNSIGAAPASTSSTATGAGRPRRSGAASARVSPQRAGQHLPRQRHQQQPERDGGQLGELLPVQPHGEDRRDDPRGQDPATERRQQSERAREPPGPQRAEPPCGAARVPARSLTRGRGGRAPARAGRR